MLGYCFPTPLQKEFIEWDQHNEIIVKMIEMTLQAERKIIDLNNIRFIHTAHKSNLS